MQLSERDNNILSWLDEKAVTNIDFIDISSITADMDKFVIGTAPNDRICRAAADHIEEKCKEFGYEIRGKEGYKSGRWILIDLTDLVIHIFVKEERETYSLEKLWADGVLLRPDDELSADQDKKNETL